MGTAMFTGRYRTYLALDRSLDLRRQLWRDLRDAVVVRGVRPQLHELFLVGAGCERTVGLIGDIVALSRFCPGISSSSRTSFVRL